MLLPLSLANRLFESNGTSNFLHRKTPFTWTFKCFCSPVCILNILQSMLRHISKLRYFRARKIFLPEAHFKPVLHSASWRLSGLDMRKLTSFYTITSVILQNTNRKPFPAASGCHSLTPILLLSSADPVDDSTHGRCSEPCQARSLPASHAAQLAQPQGQGLKW